MTTGTTRRGRNPKYRIEVAQYAAIRVLVRRDLHDTIDPLVDYPTVYSEVISHSMPAVYPEPEALDPDFAGAGKRGDVNGEWGVASSIQTCIDAAHRLSRRKGKTAKAWWVDSVIERMIATDLIVRLRPAQTVLDELLAAPTPADWDREIHTAAAAIFRSGMSSDWYGISRTDLMPFRAMKTKSRTRFERNLSDHLRQQRDNYEQSWHELLRDRYDRSLIADLTIRELLARLGAIEDGFCLMIAARPKSYDVREVAEWFAASATAYLNSVVTSS